MLLIPPANPAHQASVAQQPAVTGLAAVRAKDSAADQRIAELSAQLAEIDKRLSQLGQREADAMTRANQAISDAYDVYAEACDAHEHIRRGFERERLPLQVQRAAIYNEARPTLDRRVAENDLAAMLKMPRPSIEERR